MKLKIEEINYDKNTRSTCTDEGIQELTDSIKLIGLINPITVREKLQDNVVKYFLVSGWRRFLACERLGLKKIECNVIKCDDAVAELINIAENLQREPLSLKDEATLIYNLYINDRTIEDISALIGKSPSFVRGRLSLHTLIDQLWELVEKENISIKQAITLSTLTQVSQYAFYDIAYFDKLSDSEMNSIITTKLRTALSDATFNIEDPDLSVAGACTSCRFNTSFNQLFPDAGFCLNYACFKEKSYLNIAVKAIDIYLKDSSVLIIDTKPDDDRFDPIRTALEEANVPLTIQVDQYNIFQDDDAHEDTVRVFFINGENFGALYNAYVVEPETESEPDPEPVTEPEHKTEPAPVPQTTPTKQYDPLEDQIRALNDKLKRNDELMNEKIYDASRELLLAKKYDSLDNPMTAAEWKSLMYMIFPSTPHLRSQVNPDNTRFLSEDEKLRYCSELDDQKSMLIIRGYILQNLKTSLADGNPLMILLSEVIGSHFKNDFELIEKEIVNSYTGKKLNLEKRIAELELQIQKRNNAIEDFVQSNKEEPVDAPSANDFEFLNTTIDSNDNDVSKAETPSSGREWKMEQDPTAEDIIEKLGMS